MTNGPLTHAFAEAHKVASRQELITYYTRNGNLIKETIVRVYSSDRDYIDSSSIVVLGKAAE
jgi:ribosomal protein S8E